jgi:hypothetical protein
MLTFLTVAFCVAAILDNLPLQWLIIAGGLIYYLST